jgi:hypothetical protein
MGWEQPWKKSTEVLPKSKCEFRQYGVLKNGVKMKENAAEWKSLSVIT